MRTSLSRTLRTLALPILLTAPAISPGPACSTGDSGCSGGSSDSSGCSRRGDSVVDVYEPSTVQDLRVTEAGAASIRLAWSASTDNYAGVVGYQIRRDGSNEDYGWSDRTWFVDAGLEPATTYCYEVRAVDAQGNRSLWGGRVCATTQGAGVSRIEATSLAIAPDGRLLLAYAVADADADDGRSPDPAKLVARTLQDARSIDRGPLVVHDDVAWLFVPRTTTHSALQLAVPDVDGRWVATVRDADVREGRHAAVTWSGDTLHAACYEAVAGDLVYARWSETLGFTVVRTVDADGDVGRYPSIAQGPGEAAHLIYEGSVPGELRYARVEGASFETEIVPLESAVDPDADVAVAPDGTVHVAAYDPWAGELLHLVRSFGGWRMAVIAAVGDVGRRPAVAVGPDGVVHIVYADDTRGVLRYATDFATRGPSDRHEYGASQPRKGEER